MLKHLYFLLVAVETDGLNMGPFFLSSFSYSLLFARIILSFASLFFFLVVLGINLFLLSCFLVSLSFSLQFELCVVQESCIRKCFFRHDSLFCTLSYGGL